MPSPPAESTATAIAIFDRQTNRIASAAVAMSAAGRSGIAVGTSRTVVAAMRPTTPAVTPSRKAWRAGVSTNLATRPWPRRVKANAGRKIPAVTARAPGNPPPTWPTKVPKITRGAGRIPDNARPSTNCPSVIQAPATTASRRRNGITVYAPPNVRNPASNPDPNSRATDGLGSRAICSTASGASASPRSPGTNRAARTPRLPIPPPRGRVLGARWHRKNQPQRG
jgi:hypothetical protein